MKLMAGNSASATRSLGRAGRSVATFAWSIPSSLIPGLDSPGIGRREARRSAVYCTENHRYCDERCPPNVPIVPPFPGDTGRARRQVARLERPRHPLLIPLPWTLPPGTTVTTKQTFSILKSCAKLITFFSKWLSR